MAAAVALSACSNRVYKSSTARVAEIPSKLESMVNVSNLEVSEVKVSGVCTGKDGKYLMTQVRALVGRYSQLGDNAYYHLFLQIDKAFNAALEADENNDGRPC